jgi:hypothetical protein
MSAAHDAGDAAAPIGAADGQPSTSLDSTLRSDDDDGGEPSPSEGPSAGQTNDSLTCSGELGKRGLESDGEEAASEGVRKAPRLTASESMQLRLLAAVPTLNQPLRDSRGRRRAVCLSSSELVDAGLSALIGAHTTVGGEKSIHSPVERHVAHPQAVDAATAPALASASSDGGDKLEQQSCDQSDRRDQAGPSK